MSSSQTLFSSLFSLANFSFSATSAASVWWAVEHAALDCSSSARISSRSAWRDDRSRSDCWATRAALASAAAWAAFSWATSAAICTSIAFLFLSSALALAFSSASSFSSFPLPSLAASRSFFSFMYCTLACANCSSASRIMSFLTSSQASSLLLDSSPSARMCSSLILATTPSNSDAASLAAFASASAIRSLSVTARTSSLRSSTFLFACVSFEATADMTASFPAYSSSSFSRCPRCSAST
mmetsp:Transcript_18017/g.33593  ORF Transcript_18017/g.33593 Transcript_18017/m.33593 type:complete len:241 (-) Transcript_18017:688-1410(-)